MSKVISILSSIVLLVTLLTTNAAAGQVYPEVVINDDGSVTFTHLDNYISGNISCTVIDTNGSEAIISIKKVSSNTKSSASNTWEVSYRGLSMNCSFYMTVSNNKVSSVYNYNIDTHIGSFQTLISLKPRRMELWNSRICI